MFRYIFSTIACAVFGMMTFTLIVSENPKAQSATWHQTTDPAGNVIRRRVEDGMMIETLFIDQDGRTFRRIYRDWMDVVHVVDLDPDTGDQIAHTTL
jgi:hypothetical protein